MAGNHGFADGNKRSTIILTHLLLAKSGYRINPLEGDSSIDVAMEELVLAVVRREMKFDAMVVWFRERLHRL
jgi:death-on-curing protein